MRPVRQKRKRNNIQGDNLMNKLTVMLLVLILGLIVVPSAMYAKDHRIEFPSKAIVNGTELEAGKYKLRLTSEETAEFYSGKELVATSKVEIMPIGAATPNSVSIKRDGRLVEIRLEDERVVLIVS
jgi:competence protein ComGC